MFTSPSPLQERARMDVIAALNATLADALDLHGQLKGAHWNIKGPHFAALHPLFEEFAVELAGLSDGCAERAVTLGGRAYGSAPHVARSSRLPDYPAEVTRDLEHVALLAERFDVFLRGLREARRVAKGHEDDDTTDLLTEAITSFEKHAWFLRASLEG